MRDGSWTPRSYRTVSQTHCVYCERMTLIMKIVRSSWWNILLICWNVRKLVCFVLNGKYSIEKHQTVEWRQNGYSWCNNHITWWNSTEWWKSSHYIMKFILRNVFWQLRSHSISGKVLGHRSQWRKSDIRNY